MGKNYYEYLITGATCRIYSHRGLYLGKVWISAMGEIEVAYANTDNLPIEDAVDKINSKTDLIWAVVEE